MTPTRFATYQQAMDFLFHTVNYEKLTRFKYDLATFDLDRVRKFFAAYGSPQNAFKSVHVAGTKGKGSTSTMVAAILHEAGFKAGLFTSPHLVDLEERVAVDGRMISKRDTIALLSALSDYVSRERRDNPRLCPTFFEIVTAMAFVHFRRVGVDWAVLEVGLGGRLDSTNVIAPEACAITTIGLDHVDKLGHTLEKIAGEKAGIIKPGVPVVTAVDQPEALGVIAAKCREMNARLYRVGTDIEVSDCRPSSRAPGTTAVFKTWRHQAMEISLPLLGQHQVTNAAAALGIIAALEEAGKLPRVPIYALRSALENVRVACRAQIVGQRPSIILDAAHTVESIRALRQAIEAHVPHKRLILIMGVSKDKDFDGMLKEILPVTSEAIFSKSDSPRALEPETLAERAKALCGRDAKVVPAPADALQAARNLASPDDLICITGSFFLAGKIKEALDGMTG